MKYDPQIIEQFLHSHPENFMRVLNDFESEEISEFLVELPAESGAKVLDLLIPFKAGIVIERLPIEQGAKLIQQLELSNAISILRVTSDSVRNEILSLIEPEKSSHIRKALHFSKDQVGANLEPLVLTLTDELSVGEALLQLKREDAILKSQVFVLDFQKKLQGYIELSRLLREEPDKMIKQFIQKVPLSVSAEMQVSDLLEIWDTELTDLPVTKIDGEFLGIISRTRVSSKKSPASAHHNSAIKAGNALGDLFLIGLTGLMGRTE